jgi:uncharacterized protein YjiS (DUF1127 family)
MPTLTLSRLATGSSPSRTRDTILSLARTMLLWPVRFYRARRDLAVLGGLSDHELKDIGLMRTDLSDATGFPRDEDPTLRLARIVDERRRYRH